MNATISESRRAQIQDAIYFGKKIQAIKLYRNETRARLADAKRAVEELEESLRVASPEKFVPHVASKGAIILILTCHCVMVIALGIVSTLSVIRVIDGGKWTPMTWILCFGFVCAIFGAASAFRNHVKILWKH